MRVSNQFLKPPKILIVEDEESIRSGLRDLFVYHGFEVTLAADGEAGASYATSNDFDVVILDIMLPKKNGFEVCEEIRSQNLTLPIVMLTAKTSEDDIVNGLQLGADDYIAKPFSVQELVLRIRAILRRTSSLKTEKLQLADHMTISTHELKGETQAGEITFTLREIELLQYLAKDHFRTKTREEILHNVWGYKEGPEYDTRTVDIHIAKLRKKIETEPKQPQFLKTVRGRGYQLVESKIALS
ncbi:MAG: response regulator transcription factor [Bdellovibrionales bacterium]|nr:response regulator transcription factor [Bdellovibrionales bacterium]